MNFSNPLSAEGEARVDEHSVVGVSYRRQTINYTIPNTYRKFIQDTCAWYNLYRKSCNLLFSIVVITHIMQSKLSDIELIDQTLSGNQSAYADLVRRHQRFVFTLAMRFAKSREDAEEIAQDSFVKAYRSLHLFKRESKLSTWLYSIVYTTAMTTLRKKRLDTTSIDDESASVQVEQIPSAFNMDNAESRSRSFYVNQAISQLSADDAAIITLFYQGEQSLEEIAQTLGIEANSVKVKLFRARQRLKEKLERNLKHEAKELI